MSADVCGARFLAPTRIWCRYTKAHGHDGAHGTPKPSRAPAGPSGASISADGRAR